MIFNTNKYLYEISKHFNCQNMVFSKDRSVLVVNLDIVSYFIEEDREHKFSRHIDISVPIAAADGRIFKPTISMRFFNTCVAKSYNFKIEKEDKTDLEMFSETLKLLSNSKMKCYKIETKKHGSGYGFEMKTNQFLFFQNYGQEKIKNFGTISYGVGKYKMTYPKNEGFIYFKDIISLIPLPYSEEK